MENFDAADSKGSQTLKTGADSGDRSTALESGADSGDRRKALESPSRVRIGLRMLLVGAAFLVVVVFGPRGCKEDPVMAQGEDIFRKYCATCHQPDGKGILKTFPSLHESDWVAGDKGRLIRLALRGMQGPLEVNGLRFSNVMTPHDFLTDDQIAAVLSFVRQSFGNNADAVTAEEVSKVRGSLTDGALFEASVLEGLSGIPDSTGTTQVVDPGS